MKFLFARERIIQVSLRLDWGELGGKSRLFASSAWIVAFQRITLFTIILPRKRRPNSNHKPAVNIVS